MEHIDVRLFFRRRLKYIYIGDLMMPSKGGMNLGQFITMLRMMDAELFLEGKLPMFFLNTLTSDNDLCKSNQHSQEAYRNLLLSLKRNGCCPKYGYTIVNSYPSLQPCGGTHRIGYQMACDVSFFAPVKLGTFSFKAVSGK